MRNRSVAPRRGDRATNRDAAAGVRALVAAGIAPGAGSGIAPGPVHFHAQTWNFDIARRVSIAFGLAMMFIAFQLDHGTKEDYAFWLYFFGMISFWGAVKSMHSDNELRKVAYCAMNLGFVILTVPLRRRVFLVFGSLGVNLYVGHLAWRVFERSMLFPFALTLLGLGIITVAVWYQRHRAAIELRIESWVPLWIRDLLPPARAVAR